jgi:hypothetical protein
MSLFEENTTKLTKKEKLELEKMQPGASMKPIDPKPVKLKNL